MEPFSNEVRVSPESDVRRKLTRESRLPAGCEKLQEQK